MTLTLPNWIKGLAPLPVKGFKMNVKVLSKVAYELAHITRIMWPSTVPSVLLMPVVSALVASIDNETGGRILREGDRVSGIHISLKSFTYYLQNTFVGTGDKRHALFHTYASPGNVLGNATGPPKKNDMPDYYKFRGTWACQVTGKSNFRYVIATLASSYPRLPGISPLAIFVLKKPFDKMTSSDIDVLALEPGLQIPAVLAYTLYRSTFKKVASDIQSSQDIHTKILQSIGYDNAKGKPSSIPSLALMEAKAHQVNVYINHLINKKLI